jgi:hypothetical protein
MPCPIQYEECNVPHSVTHNFYFTHSVSWLRWLVASLSPLGQMHVGFVVNKVALGEFFSFPVSIIPLWLSIFIYHLGDEQ